MRTILLATLFFSFGAQAKFLMHYNLNYESSEDASEIEETTSTRMYHKLFFGAAVNGKRTLFLGQNINSWTKAIKQGDLEDNSYSILELGPRLIWYSSESYNWYLSVEWNPYVRGTRDVASESRDMSGSSYGAGFGYRFKLTKSIGFGASLNYSSISFNEEKIDTTAEDVSDSITMIIPMLEFSFMTR